MSMGGGTGMGVSESKYYAESLSPKEGKIVREGVTGESRTAYRFRILSSPNRVLDGVEVDFPLIKKNSEPVGFKDVFYQLNGDTGWNSIDVLNKARIQEGIDKRVVGFNPAKLERWIQDHPNLVYRNGQKVMEDGDIFNFEKPLVEEDED